MTGTRMITVENLSWGVPGRTIVDDVTVGFAATGITAIIGPNGSGKTSLLHLIAGLRRPLRGGVWLDGLPLERLTARERAQRIALVEQHPSTELDLSVRQVVELGRIPHRGRWPGARDSERDAVEQAMAVAAVEELVERRWQTLSGGERQRVHLARALAQRPQALLLDEPTNHLDLSHQIDFLERVRRLRTCTVAVLHDLDLAAAFCDRVVVLDRGRVHAAGPMAETLTADLVADVFGVRAEVTRTDRLRLLWSRR